MTASIMQSNFSDDAVSSWLTANPNATDVQRRAAMDANGVTSEQVARVTGLSGDTVQSRYAAAAPATGGGSVITARPPAPAPVAAPSASASFRPTAVDTPGTTQWADQQYARAVDYWADHANSMGLTLDDYNNGAGAQYGYVPGVRGYVGPGATAFFDRSYGVYTDPNRGSWVGNAQPTVNTPYARTAEDIAATDYTQGSLSPAQLRMQSYISGAQPAAGDGRTPPLRAMDTSPDAGAGAGGGGAAAAPSIMQSAAGNAQQQGQAGVTDAQISQWLSENPNATDAQIRQAMDANGITAQRMSQVTGIPIAEIQRRYSAAGGGSQTSGITDAQITQWLQSNPNATDAQMRQTMDANGVTPERMAQVTGLPLAEVQRRYAAAGGTVARPPAQPQYSADQIRGFINGVLGNGSDPRSQAREIIAGMQRYGVTPQQIAQATGYSIQQINNFLYGGTTTQTPPGGPTDPYSIERPEVATMEPTLRNIDFNTETTQGQLNSILNADGPLMQRARALALMRMNDSGLMNSSMAVGAAQTAMLDAAVPIANADAGVYGAASIDNQKYSNAADAFNAGETNDMTTSVFDASQKMAQLQYQSGADMRLHELDASQKMAQLQYQSGADMRLQELKNETSIQLAQIEAQYKTAMQSSESARGLYSDISKNITSIMTNPDIPAEEKSRLVAQQTELLRSGLAIAGAASNTDFLQILDFTGGTGAQNADGTPVNNTPGTAPPTIPPESATQDVPGGSGMSYENAGPGDGTGPGGPA